MGTAAILDLLTKEPPPTKHPVDVGLRTEAVVTARLLSRGMKVLQPCGFNHRYDLVLDIEGRFLRAQIKTGRLREGVIRFKTCSVRSNTRKAIIRNYDDEIDLFLVYCRDTDGIYAVPTDEAPRGEMYLRVAETENQQAVGIRWASEYAVPA